MALKTVGWKPALRGLAAGLLAAALAVSPAWADHDDEGPGLYAVTLVNTNHAHGFSFPVAATHSKDFHMFQVGQMASVQAANIAQIGTPVPMFNLLRSNAGGAVTGYYGHPFPMGSAGNPVAAWPAGLPYFDSANASTPGLYPTVSAHTLPNAISFTIAGDKDDRFSLLMMMMCTNDGLAGLDAVKLPKGLGERKQFRVYAYDAGVELNTEASADIVDPCGLMAPYAGGMPQVSTTDGNRNSPPSPSQPPPGAASDPSIQTTDPIALYDDPTVAGTGNIPASFAWDAAKPVGQVTITRIR